MCMSPTLVRARVYMPWRVEQFLKSVTQISLGRFETLFESLGWRGVDGEKVGGVRSGIYLCEIRRVAVDAQPQLVVQDATYDAFIALENQQVAGVVVRVDSRSTMVEQGLDEGVGLVVGALGCGKIGENIPCSHEIDAGNET